MGDLRVMGIHGLGDHRNSSWADKWEAAIRSQLPSDVSLTFLPFSYDDIFEKIKITETEAFTAFIRLAGSGLINGIGGLFGRKSVARGPIDRARHWLQWYAGYVVGWLENDEFREKVRKRLLTTIGNEKPDIILAHSLGSLISYDAFTSTSDLNGHSSAKAHLPNVNYVTLGSQLANAFVVSNLTPGRLVMPGVKRWWHLFNEEDAVFTSAIRLPAEPKFMQVDTFFDIDGMADHDAIEYLTHRATQTSVWLPLAMQTSAVRSIREAGVSRLAVQEGVSATRSSSRSTEPRKRALLVGINEYPDPAARLSGCVNDVFLMSSVLQECGIPAEQIRVVLNERATARGILERMEWLVDGVAPGDTLVFFYSGHGAQLPTYGLGDQVDHMDETLVPYDFDWSPESCVTDDQIYQLYSQLPYETRLVMIFDCCHSGGIHRDSGLKIRGLAPPDDVRHRGLRWDSKLAMWMPRELKRLNPEFSDEPDVLAQFTGSSGAVTRLGRAMQLRGESQAEYSKQKRGARGEPVGPYLPVILEACQESQYAFEYRHGAQSFGAFTYCLADILRSSGSITFSNLVKQTATRLDRLGYDQTPGILGPRNLLRAAVPWSGRSSH